MLRRTVPASRREDPLKRIRTPKARVQFLWNVKDYLRRAEIRPNPLKAQGRTKRWKRSRC